MRGAPDDVELAALVAGLMAAATAAPADHQTHSSAWSDRRRQLRPEPGPLRDRTPGAGACGVDACGAPCAPHARDLSSPRRPSGPFGWVRRASFSVVAAGY
ncbi:MAG: hypothetical protein NVV70_00290 [Cellulomonas sp.]|nr:acyl-CoA carboxylase subunit epsilon [Cellulomonas sp.]MCR6646653.1 hypothetical protein [Cellulomonas sp.]MCR6705891.1 hypothetical protein [Cellulomonas sp.]